MSVLSWLCKHEYNYAGRVGDKHLYKCRFCNKTTDKPVDG